MKLLAESSSEVEICKKLNSDLLRSNPCNHTIPILDFIPIDESVIMVMPLWLANYVPFPFVRHADRFNMAKQLLEVSFNLYLPGTN